MNHIRHISRVNLISFFLFFLLFISCSNATTNSNEASKPSEIKIAQHQLKHSDLQNKVFTSGREMDFEDNCVFYFECDCCSGDYVFLEDSIFYYYDYCLHQNIFLDGNYRIDFDTIILNFSGFSREKKYNFENEMDTSAIDYFFTETIGKPRVIKYHYSKCNNKIKLSYSKNDYSGIAIESDKISENVIANFEKN